MLSRIATGTRDGDLAFGARSYIVLLRFDYLLWRVDEVLAAEVDLAP